VRALSVGEGEKRARVDILIGTDTHTHREGGRYLSWQCLVDHRGGVFSAEVTRALLILLWPLGSSQAHELRDMTKTLQLGRMAKAPVYFGPSLATATYPLTPQVYAAGLQLAPHPQKCVRPLYTPPVIPSSVPVALKPEPADEMDVSRPSEAAAVAVRFGAGRTWRG